GAGVGHIRRGATTSRGSFGSARSGSITRGVSRFGRRPAMTASSAGANWNTAIRYRTLSHVFIRTDIEPSCDSGRVGGVRPPAPTYDLTTHDRSVRPASIARRRVRDLRGIGR